MSGQARNALNSLLERAENIWAGEGLTSSDPLSIEVNGKYVDIVFTTGGPHVEVQFEFWDKEDGEYWFENEVRFGRLTYMDWGTREEIFLTHEQAWLIQSGIMRDADDLVERHDTVKMTVFERSDGQAQIEVEIGPDTYLNIVDDLEPYDPADNDDREDHNTVWGPLLGRALDEAINDLNEARPGLHTMPDFIVTGWKDVTPKGDDQMVLREFEVSITEYAPE